MRGRGRLLKPRWRELYREVHPEGSGDLWSKSQPAMTSHGKSQENKYPDFILFPSDVLLRFFIVQPKQGLEWWETAEVSIQSLAFFYKISWRKEESGCWGTNGRYLAQEQDLGHWSLGLTVRKKELRYNAEVED